MVKIQPVTNGVDVRSLKRVVIVYGVLAQLRQGGAAERRCCVGS